MPATIEREAEQLKDLFDRVDKVLNVADNIREEHPEYAAELVQASRSALSSASPVRVRIAAVLLSVSDKTIRDWIHEGVLTTRSGQRRVQSLDPERLHKVIHLVQELRASGQSRDLRTSLWHMLQDSALLDRDDLAESLGQLRAGNLRPALTSEEEAARPRRAADT